MERKDTCDIQFYTKKEKERYYFYEKHELDINLFAGEDEAISLT